MLTVSSQAENALVLQPGLCVMSTRKVIRHGDPIDVQAQIEGLKGVVARSAPQFGRAGPQQVAVWLRRKVLRMAVMADDGVDAAAVMAVACRLATNGCGNRGRLGTPCRRKVRKHHHRATEPQRRQTSQWLGWYF